MGLPVFGLEPASPTGLWRSRHARWRPSICIWRRCGGRRAGPSGSWRLAVGQFGRLGDAFGIGQQAAFQTFHAVAGGEQGIAGLGDLADGDGLLLLGEQAGGVVVGIGPGDFTFVFVPDESGTLTPKP